MQTPARTVQRVHFEDFAGAEFERLVFAYHVRAGWIDIAWYGQTGSDQGRDILAIQPMEDGSRRKTVIQCVNRGALTQIKAIEDMRRALAAPTGNAEAFRFVVRGNVSAARRDAVTAAANTLGIRHADIWSGVEFEEHLRLIGFDLLQRFCSGEAFPDETEALRKFADDFAGYADSDILKALAQVFDRPAFRTPFHEESSLPAFRQAIEDTISALNTGVWRTREGTEIRRIPSLHHLRDPGVRAKVARSVQLTDQVRRVFVARLRDGSIKHCACGQEDCPVFMLRPEAVVELDQIRQQALDAFRSAHREFDVSLDR